MAMITWSDALSVNIKEIDSQHQRLVDLVNKLHDSMKSGKGNDILGSDKKYSPFLIGKGLH